MTTADTERFVAAWQANYAYLVNLAFRMLGDIGGAEDIAQEAFTRFAQAAAEDPGGSNGIEDDRAWLTVVASRLCLDHIRSARVRRERTDDTAVQVSNSPIAQPGPVNPADRITLDDEVHTALLVLLQRLSPAERVAFVLHDVFKTPFAAIAETLGRPEGTCRQLARRARRKIGTVPVRPNEVAPDEHRLVTERFITACANGDLEALLAVLDPQVWGFAEFETASLGPVTRHGPDAVAYNLMRYYGNRATLVTYPETGQPTLLAYVRRELFATITLTVARGLITKVHVRVTAAGFAAQNQDPNNHLRSGRA